MSKNREYVHTISDLSQDEVNALLDPQPDEKYAVVMDKAYRLLISKALEVVPHSHKRSTQIVLPRGGVFPSMVAQDELTSLGYKTTSIEVAKPLQELVRNEAVSHNYEISGQQVIDGELFSKTEELNIIAESFLNEARTAAAISAQMALTSRRESIHRKKQIVMLTATARDIGLDSLGRMQDELRIMGWGFYILTCDIRNYDHTPVPDHGVANQEILKFIPMLRKSQRLKH